MAQLYKPLVGERPILLARVQIKSFWQGIFQPAILLARIQSLSACWTRKSPTAFHKHPYFFSDQGWFSHLVMIGQASMPSSLHSLQMDVLSSKIWPVPICWHQTPLPYGPQRDLVTPVKLNWTFVKSSLTICSLSGPPKDTRKPGTHWLPDPAVQPGFWVAHGSGLPGSCGSQWPLWP